MNVVEQTINVRPSTLLLDWQWNNNHAGTRSRDYRMNAAGLIPDIFMEGVEDLLTANRQKHDDYLFQQNGRDSEISIPNVAPARQLEMVTDTMGDHTQTSLFWHNDFEINKDYDFLYKGDPDLKLLLRLIPIGWKHGSERGGWNPGREIYAHENCQVECLIYDYGIAVVRQGSLWNPTGSNVPRTALCTRFS